MTSSLPRQASETLPAYPPYLSLTVHGGCSLRCSMCPQWGPAGYRARHLGQTGSALKVADWCSLIDTIPSGQTPRVLLRGGEPLELPGIPRLVGAIRRRGLSLSIDSNGVRLSEVSDALGAIGGFHVTVSLDGNEPVHDRIRGVAGTFERARRGVDALREAAQRFGTEVSVSLTWTLGPENVDCLGEFPMIARQWGVPVICVVPRYWVHPVAGRQHDAELAQHGIATWAWRGFPSAPADLVPGRLEEQFEQFERELRPTITYPFLPLDAKECEAWLSSWEPVIGLRECRNAWSLLDVQPNGDANFCVDFPDWTVGNVRSSDIETIWHGAEARRFRDRIGAGLLPACRRCGAKYMGRQPAE